MLVGESVPDGGDLENLGEPGPRFQDVGLRGLGNPEGGHATGQQVWVVFGPVAGRNVDIDRVQGAPALPVIPSSRR